MRYRIISATVAALLAGVVAALAANTTFFTSVGDQVFPMAPTSIGDPVRGGMAPVNGSGSYAKLVPSAGFSATFGNFQRILALAPSGTLTYGYTTLAPNPVDGAENCTFSTQTITELTVSANAGQSINNAVTTLAANAQACFLYSQSNKTWDRSK